MRQGLELPLTGNLSEGQTSWLEGKIEILEFLRILRSLDPRSHVLGQPALPFDRSQDRLAAICQLPGPSHKLSHETDLPFIQPTGLVPAVTGDEWNGVALVEEFGRRLNGRDGQSGPLGDAPEIDDCGGSHPTRRPD